MILDRIRQIYPELTKSQQVLADFIAESYQEVAFMTASRIAKRLGLNEATVIRFAQRLGYAGYPALIEDVRQIVHAELQATPEEALAGPAQFATLAAEEMESAQRLFSHITPETAQRAADLFREAEHIVIIAQGLSAPLGHILSNHLDLLGIEDCAVVGDSLSIGLALDGVGAQTVVVAIAWAHESAETALALRLAAKRGARTLALTSSPISPCAQSAWISLVCPLPDTLPMPSASMPALLLDILMQMLARQANAAPRERLGPFVFDS